MTDAVAAVLRDVPLDPQPRVLGRGPLAAAPTIRPRPSAAAAPLDERPLADRIDAARDEGQRLGRDEARRELVAAFDRERAATAASHGQALADARLDATAAEQARSATGLAALEAAHDAALVRAAAANDLRTSLDALTRTAGDTLLDDALALAYEATARFVGEAATAANAALRRDRLQALVAQAAATQLAGQPLLCVRVHPDDLPLVEPEPSAPWAVRGDPTVERGGCRLDTARGSLDARLRTLLDGLRATWSGGVAT